MVAERFLQYSTETHVGSCALGWRLNRFAFLDADVIGAISARGDQQYYSADHQFACHDAENGSPFHRLASMQ
jgi:hypothetical protein